MSSRSIASARQKRAGEPVSISTRGPQYSVPQKSVSQPTLQPVNKISISDAIGLITIRLGRAEQFLQNLQENGFEEPSEKMPALDKTMLNNIMTRIDSIEKKEPEIDILSKINKLEDSAAKIGRLEQDIRDMKDLLMLNTIKYEKFVLEIQNKMEAMEIQHKMEVLEIQNKLESMEAQKSENNFEIQESNETVELE